MSDAINTIFTLGWAFVAWLAILAAAATLVLLGAIAVVWWALRTLWRGVSGPSWACGRLRARMVARRHARRSSRHTTDLAEETP